jgi:periplasmic divalent cation tolerance protein
MTAVIVLSTFPADQDAAALARTLVEERLAACVNVLPPMQSTYRWEGKVEQAAERQLVIKSTLARVKALKARLVELHPYDVPEVLILPVAGGSRDYLEWVAASVRTAR